MLLNYANTYQKAHTNSRKVERCASLQQRGVANQASKDNDNVACGGCNKFESSQKQTRAGSALTPPPETSVAGHMSPRHYNLPK